MAETQIKVKIVGEQQAKQAVDGIAKSFSGVERELQKAQKAFSRLIDKQKTEQAKAQFDAMKDVIHNINQGLKDAKSAQGGFEHVLGGMESESKAPRSRPPFFQASPHGRNASKSFMAGSVGGFAKSFGFGMLGALGVGAAIGGGQALASAVKNSMDYVVVLGDLSKAFRTAGDDQGRFTASVRKSLAGLGLTTREMADLATDYTRIAGAAQGEGEILNQLGYAGKLSRAYGIDINATSQQYAQMSRAGVMGGYAGMIGYGAMSADKYTALLADAIDDGKMRGRESELIGSVQSLVDQLSETQTRPAASGIADLFSVMTAMNSRADLPFMRGAYGAQFLSGISSGIMNPGGGPTGMYMMSKALGKGSFFDLQLAMEEGAFGPSGNLSKIMPYLEKTFSNLNERSYAAKSWLGGNMTKWKEFFEIYKQRREETGRELTTEEFDAISKKLQLDPKSTSDQMRNDIAASKVALEKLVDNLIPMVAIAARGIASFASMFTGKDLKDDPFIKKAISVTKGGLSGFFGEDPALAAISPGGYNDGGIAASRLNGGKIRGKIGRPYDKRGLHAPTKGATPMSAADHATLEALAGAPGNRVPLGFIQAILDQESGGMVDATGTSGEIGAFQIMPANVDYYGPRFGVQRYEDAYDFRKNASIGLALLNDLHAHYGGDLDKVALAYNAGQTQADLYFEGKPARVNTGYQRSVIQRYRTRETRPSGTSKIRVPVQKEGVSPAPTTPEQMSLLGGDTTMNVFINGVRVVSETLKKTGNGTGSTIGINLADIEALV